MTEVGQQSLRRSGGALDAIRNADPVVGIAGQDKTWEVPCQCLNMGDALLMSDVVLGHGLWMTTDAAIEWCAGNP